MSNNFTMGSALQAAMQTYDQVQQTGQNLAQQGNDIYSSVANGAFGNPNGSSSGSGFGSGLDSIGQGGSQQGMMQILEMELQLMMATLQQMMQAQQAQQGQPSQHVDQASGSSWGDPHQSFNGSNGSNQMSGKSDNMGSLADLVDANKSINGGYQVSTQTSAPDSKGITYNDSASVKFGNGNDSVTMGQDGAVTVSSGDRSMQLQKGQSGTLDGATISEDKNGVVTIADKNDQGGSISTSLNWNGKGVDANFTASNIDLGGYDVGLASPSTKDTKAPMDVIG